MIFDRNAFGRFSGLLAKLFLVTLVAGFTAALAYIAMVQLGVREFNLVPQSVLFYATIANLLIGFPVAFLVFLLSGQRLAHSLEAFAMVAALASVMLLITSFVFGGAFFAYWLGIPSVASVLTYALLGWFWILKPMRKAEMA